VNGNQLALRPLRHFADFSGRSTRGELFYFGLLFSVLGFPAVAVDLALWPGSSVWVMAGITALFACPFLAMSVRRLHDTGWSGWWILALLPALGAGAWNEVQRLLHPLVYPPPRLPLPLFAALAIGGLALAVVILLLRDGEEAANRYGPNPRHGPAGEPA
jgi:uncharacterized membrane protein YhaH (DUF805 family)